MTDDTGMSTDRDSWQMRMAAEDARAEAIRRCRLHAARLYGKPTILSHEPIARDLGRFLAARLAGDDVLLSIVEFETRIATYLSCGEAAIQHALAVLLRLAMAHDEHPDYREEWRPWTP